MAQHTTPEMERLIDEIYASGNYTSHSDVLNEALRSLHERTRRETGKTQLPRISPTRRRKLALGAWGAQVLTTIVAVVLCALDVETIIGTGPALTLSGLALVVLARPLRSARVLTYGLSGPLVCALGATLIAGFQWGPRDAATPILAILIVYACVSIPAALLAIRDLLPWQPAPEVRRPIPLQFSLRSLLLVTTALCVLITLFRFIFGSASEEPIIFGTFVVVTICLVGVTLFLFVVDRHRL